MRKLGVLLMGFVAVAVACGGSTSGDGSGTGGSATGGSGGSSASGATGGSATGGSGGSSASGGTGNVAGLTACDAPGTCELFAKNCCGGYCDPNAPLSGWQAVNSSKTSELEAQLCQGDIACPGCMSQDNLAYLALCRAGQCTAVDLRKDELSACKSHDECRVRWGSDCCESCGVPNAESLIAYNKNVSLEQQVCDPKSGGCPPCAPPPYPPYILPICGSDGHCTTTLVGP